MDDFDAYYKWLGIPPEEQPPHHYRLLGIRVGESDVDVIDAAADRQMAHLQRYANGQHADLSQRLLNEVAKARVTLLNPSAKATYDAAFAKPSPSPMVRPAPLVPQERLLESPAPLPKTRVTLPEPAAPLPIKSTELAIRPEPRTAMTNLPAVAPRSAMVAPLQRRGRSPALPKLNPQLLALIIGAGGLVLAMFVGAIVLLATSPADEPTAEGNAINPISENSTAASTSGEILISLDDRARREVSVKLDGKSVRLSPFGSATITCAAGPHLVEIARPNFKTFTEQIDVEPNGLKSIYPQWISTIVRPKHVPPGAEHFAGHWYQVVDEPVTWSLAQQRCDLRKGYLVRINNYEEQYFIEQMMAAHPMNNCWLDGTDEAAEGSWQWDDGSPMNYEAWGDSQPNNGNSTEHYIEYDEAIRLWHDNHGGRRFCYICEWKPQPIEAKTTAAKPQIPPSAITVGNKHFLHFEEEVTVHLAHARCAAMGGRLARITTPIEQQQVFAMIAETKTVDYWIDGSDQEVEGEWRTTDGSKLLFTNWLRNEPNNHDDREHWVTIVRTEGGRWNDTDCGYRYGFICEWSTPFASEP